MIDVRDQLSPGALVQVPCEPEDVRLEDVLDQREAAGHVAVERRVPDRELRLVARREHEPAELVRERHQEHAANPRLQVLLGEIGLAAGEDLRERRLERVVDRVDRQLEEVRAERLRERARVMPRRLGRVTRRHRHAVHALRAERLDRERRDERRVDPAGDAEHDVAEPVLLDVVAQPELEREAHLLERVEHRRDLAAEPCAARSTSRGDPMCTTETGGGVSRSCSSARRRTSRRRRPITASGSRSTTSSASSNPGARAITSPSSSSTTE